MKLKNEFIIQEVGDQHMAVAPEYRGLLRMNEAGSFILTKLLEDTSEEKLLDALCEQYDAPRDTLAADLGDILAALRGADLLDE